MPASGITINMPKIQLSTSLYIDKIKSKNFLVFLKKYLSIHGDPSILRDYFLE